LTLTNTCTQTQRQNTAQEITFKLLEQTIHITCDNSYSSKYLHGDTSSKLTKYKSEAMTEN